MVDFVQHTSRMSDALFTFAFSNGWLRSVFRILRCPAGLCLRAPPCAMERVRRISLLGILKLTLFNTLPFVIQVSLWSFRCTYSVVWPLEEEFPRQCPENFQYLGLVHRRRLLSASCGVFMVIPKTCPATAGLSTSSQSS